MTPSSPIVHSSIAADANAFARPPWPRVRSDQGPVVLHDRVSDDEVAHQHLHVGKRGHERLSGVSDRRSPHRWHTTIDGQGALRCVVPRDPCRVLAAPSLGVAPSEIIQVIQGWRHQLSSCWPPLAFRDPRILSEQTKLRGVPDQERLPASPRIFRSSGCRRAPAASAGSRRGVGPAMPVAAGRLGT